MRSRLPSREGERAEPRVVVADEHGEGLGVAVPCPGEDAGIRLMGTGRGTCAHTRFDRSESRKPSAGLRGLL